MELNIFKESVTKKEDDLKNIKEMTGEEKSDEYYILLVKLEKNRKELRIFTDDLLEREDEIIKAFLTSTDKKLRTGAEELKKIKERISLLEKEPEIVAMLKAEQEYRAKEFKLNTEK
jgi:hypothetical protein